MLEHRKSPPQAAHAAPTNAEPSVTPLHVAEHVDRARERSDHDAARIETQAQPLADEGLDVAEARPRLVAAPHQQDEVVQPLVG